MGLCGPTLSLIVCAVGIGSNRVNHIPKLLRTRAPLQLHQTRSKDSQMRSFVRRRYQDFSLVSSHQHSELSLLLAIERERERERE